jgi:DNA polymerase I-like protein with 3'-5' exonuclease and polymerase domains
MTVILWTGAESQSIRKVFQPVLSRQQVRHQIIPFPPKEQDLIIPQVGDGDVLLCCGNRGLEAFAKAGIFPDKKKRTIGSLREKPWKRAHGNVLFTYDPGMCNIDWARVPEMQWDMTLAIRLHETGTTALADGWQKNYQWLDSLHELIEEVDRRFEETGKPVYMACDIETMGLDEYRPGVRILSISFTIKDGQSLMLYFEEGEKPTEPLPWKDPADYDYWEGLWEQINWLLTTDKIRTEGANFKYDSRWITHHWAISCTNQRFDTMLAGTLLDENRSNSLKLHAKIMTPLGGYEDGMDKYDMGHLETVPKEELGPYMGGDTDVTHRCAAVMRKELAADHKLANFYTKLLMPSAKVFEKMERVGVCVDAPYYDLLETKIEAEQERLIHQMKALCGGKLKAKYSDNFSFTRPNLIKDLFFSPLGFNLKPLVYTEKAKEMTTEYASTSVDHLMMFGEYPEAKAFVDLLSQLNSANKTLSTYVRGFRKHLRSDGRFHPSYMLFRGDYGNDDDDSGTDTGRTSAKDPAVQTIPKHTKWTKWLRRAFIAPPGMTILQLDFSQGELRIAACLANEPTMIDAYANGKDLHAVTGAKLAGYSFEDFMLLPDNIRDPFRSQAKPANFGLLYGMGAEGYQAYAFTAYGVKLTLEQAEAARNDFFDLYDRLLVWHDYYKNIAKKDGQIRSPLGRLRHLPLIHSRDRQAASKAGRNAVNSPVQSTLSDMMQYAMVLMDREYPELQFTIMTHDSIAIYVPIGEEAVWAKRLKGIMENMPLKKEFGWDHQLKFMADAEASVEPSFTEPELAELNDGVRSLMSLKKLKVLA